MYKLYIWMYVYTKNAIVTITYRACRVKGFSVADYYILVISVACVYVTHHEVLLNRTP